MTASSPMNDQEPPILHDTGSPLERPDSENENTAKASDAKAEPSIEVTPEEIVLQLQNEVLSKDLRVKDLQSRVDEFESKISDIRAYVKKMEGETDQVRERIQRDLQKTLDKKISDSALGLIRVMDNFDRSLRAAVEDQSSLAVGVRLIYAQMTEVLKSMNVVRMSIIGTKFDPNLHEALATQKVPGSEQDGIILEEAVVGYLYKEQLLRAAQVVVGKYEEQQ